MLVNEKVYTYIRRLKFVTKQHGERVGVTNMPAKGGSTTVEIQGRAVHESLRKKWFKMERKRAEH